MRISGHPMGEVAKPKACKVAHLGQKLGHGGVQPVKIHAGGAGLRGEFGNTLRNAVQRLNSLLTPKDGRSTHVRVRVMCACVCGVRGVH